MSYRSEYRNRRYNHDIDDPSYHQRQRNRGRGRGRGRDNYRNRRRNNDEPPIDPEEERRNRIRQLLVRIGEKSERALSNNLDQLATALLNDIDIYGPYIISTLFECLSHLAVKIPIYATLVGLINHVQNDFGQKVVDTLSNELSVAMMTNKENTKSIIADTNKQRGLETPIIDFNRIRLLMRFGSDLYNANIICLIDILNIVNFLMEQGLNEKVNRFVQEHVVYVIVMTLIWCANGHSFVENETEIEGIMKRIGAYIENRTDVTNPIGLRPFKSIQIDLLGDVWNEYIAMYKCKTNENNKNNDGDGMKSEEKSNLYKGKEEDIDTKMTETKDAKPNVFEIKSIYSPYKEFSRLKKRYSHSLKLKVDEYEIGSWEAIKVKNLYPIWLEFGIPSLLNQQQQDNEGKSVNKMEQIVAMDYIHDIVEYFNQSTQLAADQLINLPTSFESKYLIVEGLVFKMLRLPQCKHHYIIFGKIIIDLFRKQTKVYPRIVGPIINKLFHSIDNVDIECRDRLVEWFSFHLANFNFQWPWENWSNVTSFPSSSPKTAFVRAVMTKCLHLSYYDRFKKTLPNDIICIVPHKPEGNYQYSANNIVAMNLVRMLNQRQSAEDIAGHLETYIEPKSDKMHFDELAVPLTEPQDVILRQIELLFVCILHVGKSSCSHVLSFLKLYGKKPLKQLIGQTPVNNEEGKVATGQLVLLQCLFDYWQYSPIRVEILLDKLHAMNYVTPQSILQFVFSKASIEHLHKQIYWIVVLQAMDRMVKTTQGMQRGIQKFEQDIEELNKNLNSDFNDQEMTMLSKQNKEKQLNQLTNRLQTLENSIGAVMNLFVKHCVKSLYWLIEKMNKKKEQNVNDKEDANEDEDEEEEMNDDALMSEQFVVKNEEKEKEKLALLKSRKANTDKYIFDVINGRMVEICRRFYQYISVDNLNDIDLKSEEKNENYQQIIDSIQSIRQIKELTL